MPFAAVVDAFRGDEVLKEVRLLSGGERSRLELALLGILPSNLLLLDEPTNHLDIPAREALETFLRESAATVIVVSHDRRFLETICDRLWVVDAGLAGEDVTISTGAGIKHLRLLARTGREFTFEMGMGTARIEELHARIEDRDCVILNVGNPQCAFLVDDFAFDWVAMGARVERHPRFPNRTNVSFVKVIDRHTLDVRFFERGAGETMSSGTGSTGAVAAAIARGLVESPVRVQTPAGPLDLRWQDESILLAGPAEIIASGEFFWKRNHTA